MQNQGSELRISVRSTIDIVTARQQGRDLALKLGFSIAEVTLVAAAISEIARNMVDHARGGDVMLSLVQRDVYRGVQVVAQDHGPGIPDLTQAMQYGFSTRKGLGVGLPGAKWLMDDFEVDTEVGRGTTVTMRKWLKNESNHT
jgi:serine/threonine-protein kinase RsbT